MRTIYTILSALLLVINFAIAQDTLYIYKSGSVVTKRAVNDIDSVIFYKANDLPQGNTVMDIDGNIYNIVTIGSQKWLKENLKTTHYNDGTLIPLISDSPTWGSQTNPAYCWYNNDEVSYKIPYGALYNWYAVNTNKVCPTGWHVPTLSEFSILFLYVNGKGCSLGDGLKEVGSDHWGISNTGNNSSGFTAVPGGSRWYSDGEFDYITLSAYFWSNSIYDTKTAYCSNISNTSCASAYNYTGKASGKSVRCIKN